MLGDFKRFLLRGSVVDLAVGVVIGAAFGTLVNALVRDLITPVLAAVGGQPDFGALSFRIGRGVFRYGDFLDAAIAFAIVAAAVFFGVVRPVNALMARFKTEPEVEAVTRECPECLSAVPARARRCAYCTAEIG